MDFFFYFCYNYFKKGYDNMKYNIRGDKLEVTSAIENYVENKLDRLNKYFQNDEVVANVLLKVRGREQIIEVTIPADKYILRGEVGNDDLYSAIDLVTDKLERQIRKNKTRLSKQNKGYKDLNLNFDIEENDIEDESIKYNIVKRKTLEMKPMDEEEAILEMNLLGHDLYIRICIQIIYVSYIREKMVNMEY